MVSFIANYFIRTESYSASRFIIEMFLLQIIGLIILNFIIGFVSYLGYDPIGIYNFKENYLIDNYHWFFALLVICCVVPLFETIISQFIPIVIVSRWTKNRVMPIILSATLFTFLHSYSVIVLFYIFFSGIIYAWSFMVFNQKGCVAGVIVTSIIHGLDNFMAFILLIIH